MTGLVRFRAGRALVVTLSALTLANLLELSHRLAYDTRLWAQLTSPDAPYRYFGTIGGPLAVAVLSERTPRLVPARPALGPATRTSGPGQHLGAADPGRGAPAG